MSLPIRCVRLLRLHSSFLADHKEIFTHAEVTLFANIIVWNYVALSRFSLVLASSFDIEVYSFFIFIYIYIYILAKLRSFSSAVKRKVTSVSKT